MPVLRSFDLLLIIKSSHGHWDHVGDITVFPSTTELVVGPGFKEAFCPGYPTKPEVELPERYFE